jgi:hypothetical protein
MHVESARPGAGRCSRGLGAGESGKSTILKQMRLIHTEGFPDHERREVRQVIFSNMVVAFKIIAEEMRDLGLKYERVDTEVCRPSARPLPRAPAEDRAEARGRPAGC